MIYSETANEPRFRIAHPSMFQQAIRPLTFMLYDRHFVSLATRSINGDVFDLNRIKFFNPFVNSDCNILLVLFY